MKYQPRYSKRQFGIFTDIGFGDTSPVAVAPMEMIPAPPMVREWPDTLHPYELLKGWRYLGDRTFRYDTTDDPGDHLYPALSFGGIIGGLTYRVTGEIVDFESNSPPPSTGQKVTLRFGYIGTNSIDLNTLDHAPYTFLDLLEVAGDENGTIRFITNDRVRVRSFQIRNLMITVEGSQIVMPDLIMTVGENGAGSRRGYRRGSYGTAAPDMLSDGNEIRELRLRLSNGNFSFKVEGLYPQDEFTSLEVVGTAIVLDTTAAIHSQDAVETTWLWEASGVTITEGEIVSVNFL